MRSIGVYLLLAAVIQSFGFAEVTKLPANERKALENFSPARLIVATNLPPAIVALCADHSGKLAEPGQRWQEADFVADTSLPQKRLIWAAVSGERYVVHYEKGGRGHSFHVAVFSLAKGEQKPKVIWRGIGFDRFKDYAAFLDGLRSGKLNDKLNYAH